MTSAADPSVELATVERVVERYPVRIAVIFGSQVTGSATAASDLDVAVAFDDSLSTVDRHRARLDLTVDLMAALGTDEVDITDLAAVRPAVGLAALRDGIRIVGEAAAVESLSARLESRTETRSHPERVRQFDELLERLEETV